MEVTTNTLTRIRRSSDQLLWLVQSHGAILRADFPNKAA